MSLSRQARIVIVIVGGGIASGTVVAKTSMCSTMQPSATGRRTAMRPAARSSCRSAMRSPAKSQISLSSVCASDSPADCRPPISVSHRPGVGGLVERALLDPDATVAREADEVHRARRDAERSHRGALDAGV